MRLIKAARSLIGISSLLALAACGGGGDSAAPAPTPTYTIAGTVTGLSGTGLVLQNSGAGNLTVTGSSFIFATAVNSGSAYAVTVLTQPSSPSQTCTVTNGTGTATANVTNVAIVCATTTRTISGTISGLTGTGLVIHEASNQNATITGNAFTFPTALASGSTYTVTVTTQPSSPSQLCTVANGTGTIAAANITNVTVTCAAPASLTVGGTVSGLATGGTVVLQNNGGNNLTVAANGSFTFSTPINTGATYAVTRLTNPTVPAGTPAGQTCTVTNGSGTVASANVTTVTVTCVNNDLAAPTVSSRSPANTALGARLQTTITAVLSEVLDPATVTGSTFTVVGPFGAVAGAVTLTNGNQTAVFTPSAPLNFGSTYTATLTTAVKDLAGNSIAPNTNWHFNTGDKTTVAGHHACARMTDGRVKCWGYNNFGQLGIDNTVDHGDGTGLMGDGTGANGSGLLAVNLGAGRTAIAVADGEWHSCAILDNGQVKCWGRNDHGQLGLGFTSTNVGGHAGDMAFNILPVNLGAGHTAVEITAGEYVTCARLDDGSVKCWGANEFGQLGQGNNIELGIAANDIASASPIALGTGRSAVQITAGLRHICAILDDNTLKCWGQNHYGQLGLGDTNDRGDNANEMGDQLPVINLGTGADDYAVEVHASSAHNCARLHSNAVRCWGNNGWGQVGNNAGNDGPANRAVCEPGRSCIGDQPGEMGDSLAKAIGDGLAASNGVGDRHSCARLVDGTVKCWGSNEAGQLGLGDINEPKFCIGDAPGEIAAMAVAPQKPGKTLVDMAVGGFFQCVSNTDDSVNCWGDNDQGQMGLGNTNVVGDGSGEMGSNLIDLNLGT